MKLIPSKNQVYWKVYNQTVLKIVEEFQIPVYDQVLKLKILAITIVDIREHIWSQIMKETT